MILTDNTKSKTQKPDLLELMLVKKFEELSKAAVNALNDYRYFKGYCDCIITVAKIQGVKLPLDR